MKYPNNWYFYRNKRIKCEEYEINNFIGKIRDKLNISVFVMNDTGYEGLCDVIIDFFAE